MAELFRAKIAPAHGFEKILVIKRILPHLAADPTFVAMFIDEAKLTAQLTHPKIVQVLDFGDVDGPVLHRAGVRRRHRRAGAAARVRAASACACRRTSRCTSSARCSTRSTTRTTRATGRARRCGIVHRDISPSNIFISQARRREAGRLRHRARRSERESKTAGRHAQGQVRLHVARAGGRAASSTGAAICSRSASCSPRC